MKLNLFSNINNDNVIHTKSDKSKKISYFLRQNLIVWWLVVGAGMVAAGFYNYNLCSRTIDSKPSIELYLMKLFDIMHYTLT